jgi:hypothetical protein
MAESHLAGDLQPGNCTKVQLQLPVHSQMLFDASDCGFNVGRMTTTNCCGSQAKSVARRFAIACDDRRGEVGAATLRSDTSPPALVTAAQAERRP